VDMEVPTKESSAGRGAPVRAWTCAWSRDLEAGGAGSVGQGVISCNRSRGSSREGSREERL